MPLPRVLTIPPTAPFLSTLARALLDGRLIAGFAPGASGPLGLAAATVFLPTRRACRLFAEALLQQAGTDALLLPSIVPLGDVDEDALAFSEDAPVLAAPHATAPVHRRLVLASLVARWRAALKAGEGRAAVAAGPAATLALADELARLFDDLSTAGVPISRLDGLTPRELDPYFEISLEFVRIARMGFDAYLAAAGLVEPAVRRDALVDAEARRLTVLGLEAGPVIAAGSTGSMPATARLLKAISRLPQGAVVLPGLDLHMEDEAFSLLIDPIQGAPDHPQYGLAKLLKTLDLKRADVEPLAIGGSRERLLSEAMRQAETSDLWAQLPQRLPQAERALAVDRLTVVEADDPRQEALAVALLLRESLERPGEMAALVTPDRDLARRVVSEMARFGVAVDDSAGTPLAEAPVGRLARLIAQVAAEGWAPVPLFALLSHPLAGFGLDPELKGEALAALELAALRGPRPRAGVSGLRAALESCDPDGFRGADPRRRLTDAALHRAGLLVDQLEAAMAPLSALAERRGALPLPELVEAHRAAFEAIAGPLDEMDEDPARAALARAFRAVGDAAADGPELALFDYADAVSSLIGDAMVRPVGERHARLRILGPLEARLVRVDRVVLGGLVEGMWPQQGETDPWLSRPMRLDLGLDLPERRIGLSAHDFVQAFGANEVVLTYAGKVGGTQSVPSRFLKRLETVLGRDLTSEVRARGRRWTAAAAALDVAQSVPRATRPAPAPPLALRPRRLTVTEIETFLRDPYSIFARHVLGLQPLDPLDAAPGAAERGTALHAALGTFTGAFPRDLPRDALDQLLAHGRAAFAPLAAFPAEHAVWWARFERVAAFVVEFERRRRAGCDVIVPETPGQLDLPLGENSFRLAGRADRIEVKRDGTLAILDYKTGSAPTAKQVASLSPQLALEAAMAARGAFRDVPPLPVSEITYVELKGGAAGGEEKPIRYKDRSPTDVAETALSGLISLLAAFEDEAQGYRSLAAPQWQGGYGDYDHLARVREWALGGEEEQ
ncbi:MULTISPECIES: double-strand break repair protein AddB [unclassified Xanthobacter]|uniref:double-strand break repair protein AddB n=1 Tax=unclassified Xanthobacter TaxID=2623496 RepID=UPI001F2F69D3